VLGLHRHEILKLSMTRGLSSVDTKTQSPIDLCLEYGQEYQRNGGTMHTWATANKNQRATSQELPYHEAIWRPRLSAVSAPPPLCGYHGALMLLSCLISCPHPYLPSRSLQDDEAQMCTTAACRHWVPASCPTAQDVECWSSAHFCCTC